MIGTRLAHYEITERLGEGGMGVVWKATDTTLGRSVAIKVLPEVLARDPERLARLEREARLLAALSHPNIASIFGLHEDQGVRFLAMELAPGESLAARLERGAMPAEEALPVALRIAEALEHAHEHGIVHRDLKPANVVIGADGAVKVLDFGLAKAFESETTGASNPSLTQSPTITAGMTQANVILGTAAYMSAEQARGQAADKRADVWSFGVVLFEMLTGTRMFEGETVSDTLAAVLRADPAWDRLPGGTPPRVRTLLARCLERDRRARLRDIGEARIQLAAELAGTPDPHLQSLASGPGLGEATPAATGSRAGGIARWVAVGVAALVLGALLGRGLGGSGGGSPPIPHRMLGLSAGSEAAHPMISPDGLRVAWLEGDTIHVRELDSLEPLRIPVRARPLDLFWAPDGLTLGYVSGSRVFALELRSRNERQVCDARGPFTGGAGATWGDDGIITLSRAESDGLMQVPAAGGDARTVLPTDSLVSDYHDPHALPGRRGVLFVSHKIAGGMNNLSVFDGKTRREVLQLEGHILSDPVYAASGHILYRRNSPNPGIWAVPFSLDRLETTGDPFIVAPEGNSPSVSADGTLVCLSGSAVNECDLIRSGGDGSTPVTLARVGAAVGVFPALSPDGRRLAVGIDHDSGVDLWVLDLDRGTRTRLTFDPGTETLPVWTPDGRSIVYQARSAGGSEWNILRRAADGSDQPDTLARGSTVPHVSPDGASVLFTRLSDFKLCSVAIGGGAVRELGPADGVAKAAVSPDGRYIAYASTETGRSEVFLRRYPDFTGKWQVSAGGGDWPVWKGSGDRLYFAADDEILSVDVVSGDVPQLGAQRRLFSRPHLSARAVAGWSAPFTMSADGETFIYGVDVAARGESAATLLLNQNWLGPFTDRTSL
jgi:serine/threonine-protein kinase